MGEAIDAALLAVADTERMDHREIARAAFGKEPLLDFIVQERRLDEPAATADEPDGIAILDQAGNLACLDELRRHQT